MDGQGEEAPGTPPGSLPTPELSPLLLPRPAKPFVGPQRSPSFYSSVSLVWGTPHAESQCPGQLTVLCAAFALRSFSVLRQGWGVGSIGCAGGDCCRGGRGMAGEGPGEQPPEQSGSLPSPVEQGSLWSYSLTGSRGHQQPGILPWGLCPLKSEVLGHMASLGSACKCLGPIIPCVYSRSSPASDEPSSSACIFK